jgi:uncharacterized C2H2 Zn-finger protein
MTIYDITSIKIGKHRFLADKLIFRRGDDLYLVDGQDFNYDGLVDYLGLKPPKTESTALITLNTCLDRSKKIAVAFIEPPSRVISYHLVDSTVDLTLYKVAAIAMKVILYTTTVVVKNNRLYAEQPWYIDWDTSHNQKAYVKSISQDIKDISCPLCLKSYAKLSSYINHVIDDHSYIKRKNKTEQVVEAESSDYYKCPYCDKVLKSKFGRTNHIKMTHPDKV